MAKPFAAATTNSADGGRAAFTALATGGRSGLEVVFGVVRREDDESARLEAHGPYGMPSEAMRATPGSKLGRNRQILDRHQGGETGIACRYGAAGSRLAARSW